MVDDVIGSHSVTQLMSHATVTKTEAATIAAAATENTSANQEDNAKSSNETTNAAKKPVWQKKPRYNGQQKKRRWEPFNRRDDTDEKRVRTNPEERVKKRKYCILLGFAGANFFGMQRNPGVNTIEEELLKALLKNKLINDEGFNQPQMIHFQRAARTDKGVSASRQCCSMKLPEEVDLEKLNGDLPPEIRVFKLKRVTKGFNAKDQCNSRTYSYTLPTISFAPYTEKFSLQEYRATKDTLEHVNETLKLFEGTHNFHNFTSRKAFADPSANRFINLFECGEPFLASGVEFCVVHVKGQSFMMHQIRKMIGLTLAVVRGITTADTIARSFKENRIDIPMAPGLGLVLDQAHYDGYNNRYGDDGMHELLVWDDCDTAVQEFRDKFIHPVIVETEIVEQPMIKWLETIPLHSYDERIGNLDKSEIMRGDSDDDEQTLDPEIDDAKKKSIDAGNGEYNGNTKNDAAADSI